MDLAVILLGAIFGFIIAALKESAPPLRTKRASEPIPHRDQYSTLEYYQRRRRQLARRMQAAARLRQSSILRQAMNVNGKNLVEDWHRSIISLVKLGDQNLALARQYVERKECKSAVEDASTSVENIARALIHCYGGKPEHGSGQEEPLRMLSNRFQGDERIEFEEACDLVAHIRRNTQPQFFNEARIREIIEAASTIGELFKQIMVDHFANEILELNEMCPNCHSLDTTLFSFNKKRAYYGCKDCHHNWTEPRHKSVQ